ncbi:glycosyltransferase family 2 protein [Bacillus sp. EB106-08-02-XG196]|uniref:glycosyltransferase family 2 protein n=1 Tax=Bacillus sp. EB106-08-02-XG196 TaxID=2737049 RepID=UPI0015C4A4FC|nr:glycosyltransferase [Bacillus sp. EB106-08-02-XG196]NWQ41096.1 glycosyltransferase family 2 protein [Bacillus sp. EB106-08-02-XG196]
MDGKVSIVIPTVNRIDKLLSVLSSYLQQKNILEIIIIDDCSTDGTEKYFKDNYNSKIRFVKNESPLGAAKSKFKGIQIAKGDYILFGEDDLYLEKDYTEVLIANLLKENADFIAGRIIYLNEQESEEDALNRNNIFVENLYDKYFNHNFYSTSTKNEDVIFLHGIYLVRTAVIRNIGIDGNYKGNGWREETDPLIVAKSQGRKVIFCPFTVCFHLPRGIDKGGQHNNNKLIYEFWVFKNNLYFFKKNQLFLRQNNIIKGNPYKENILYMSHRIYNNYLLKIIPKFKKALKTRGGN